MEPTIEFAADREKRVISNEIMAELRRRPTFELERALTKKRKEYVRDPHNKLVKTQIDFLRTVIREK